MIVKVGAEKSLTVPTLTMTMGTAYISNVSHYSKRSGSHFHPLIVVVDKVDKTAFIQSL